MDDEDAVRAIKCAAQFRRNVGSESLVPAILKRDGGVVAARDVMEPGDWRPLRLRRHHKAQHPGLVFQEYADHGAVRYRKSLYRSNRFSCSLMAKRSVMPAM